MKWFKFPSECNQIVHAWSSNCCVDCRPSTASLLRTPPLIYKLLVLLPLIHLSRTHLDFFIYFSIDHIVTRSLIFRRWFFGPKLRLFPLSFLWDLKSHLYRFKDSLKNKITRVCLPFHPGYLWSFQGLNYRPSAQVYQQYFEGLLYQPS